MLLRTSLLILPLMLMAGSPALAECDCTPVSAPEIDAGSGLAALAAVGGVLAYAFERRRRPRTALPPITLEKTRSQG